MAEQDDAIQTELQLRLLQSMESIAASDPHRVTATLAQFPTPTNEFVAIQLMKVLGKLVPEETSLPLSVLARLLSSRSAMVVYGALQLAERIAPVAPQQVWLIVREHFVRLSSDDNATLHLNGHPWGGLFKVTEIIAKTDQARFIPQIIDLRVELNRRLMKPEIAADPATAARFDWPTIMITGWNLLSSIHEDDLVWVGITSPLLSMCPADPVEALSIAKQLLAREEPFARRAAIWPIARIARDGNVEARLILAAYLDFEFSKNWHIWTTAHAQLVELAEVDPDWVISELEAATSGGREPSEFDVAALSKLVPDSGRARSLLLSFATNDADLCKSLLANCSSFAAVAPEFASEILNLALEQLDPSDEDLIFATRGILEAIGASDFALVEPLFQAMIDRPNISRRPLIPDELVSTALRHPGSREKVRRWLSELTQDPDPHVRESVASAVAKLRDVEPEFVLQTLQTLAHDPDPAPGFRAIDEGEERSVLVVRTVRGHAASALASIADKFPDEVSESLFVLARDPVAIVRWLALNSLNTFANWGGAQVRLQDLLDPEQQNSPLGAPSKSVRLAALHLAWHPAVHDASFAARLVPALQKYMAEGGELCRQAIHAAVGLEEEHRSMVLTNLVEMVITAPDAELRRFGAQALRSRAQEGFEHAYPRLLRLSRDPDPGVREEVALGWSRFFEVDPNHVRQLVIAAIESLEHYGLGDPMDRYPAILLHLVNEILKTFSHEHVDWTIDVLNRAAGITSTPVLSELLHVLRMLPAEHWPTCRPFLAAAIEQGLSAAAEVIHEMESGAAS